MPYSTDAHACFVCKTSFTMRKALKNHLTKTKADEKPRCPALKKVIPSDVWLLQILPFYRDGAPKADLPYFKILKGHQVRKEKRRCLS